MYRTGPRASLKLSGGVMARKKNFPPTTIYKIHDYETDARELEKAKGEMSKEKTGLQKREAKAERHLTDGEREILSELRKKRR